MGQQVFYFAYGSNMNIAQIASRCPTARFVSAAWVNGYELRFAGYSSLWDGGVATMYPSLDTSVTGKLFEMSASDLDRMDVFEGYYYSRVPIFVNSYSGTVEAITYLRTGVETPPSSDYFQTILDGTGENQVHDKALWSARMRSQKFNDKDFRNSYGGRSQVFVYGTLMSGQSNHHILKGPGSHLKYSRDDTTTALMPGFEMHDLGAFPALCISHNGRRVEGELYVVDDEALARLDRLEGHPEFYHRILVDYEVNRKPRGLVETGRAWVYVMHAYEAKQHPPIESGNWLHHIGACALT